MGIKKKKRKNDDDYIICRQSALDTSAPPPPPPASPLQPFNTYASRTIVVVVQHNIGALGRRENTVVVWFKTHEKSMIARMVTTAATTAAVSHRSNRLFRDFDNINEGKRNTVIYYELRVVHLYSYIINQQSLFSQYFMLISFTHYSLPAHNLHGNFLLYVLHLIFYVFRV